MSNPQKKNQKKLSKTERKLSKKESRVSILVSFMLVLSVLASAGIYVFVKHVSQIEQEKEEEIARASEKKAQEEAAQKAALEKPDIGQDIENLLNEFLTSIAAQSKTYKKQRKMLFELVRPENLREKEYIEENYALAKGLLPDLHRRMNLIIETFEITQNNILLILEGQGEDMRQTVWAEWLDLKQKQISPYVEYFSFESRILQTYEELMDFYYVKQNKYDVNLDASGLVFRNPDDEETHQRLKQELKDLSHEQTQAFAR